MNHRRHSRLTFELECQRHAAKTGGPNMVKVKDRG